MQEVTNYYANLYGLKFRTMPKARSEINLFAGLAFSEGLIFKLAQAFSYEEAVGKQLDILDSYIGVGRQLLLNNNLINLNDDELRFLLNFKKILNYSNASYPALSYQLSTLFGNDFKLYDGYNMTISYFIHERQLTNLNLLLVKNLLPKPMGVQIAFIYVGKQVEGHFGFTRVGFAGKAGGFNRLKDISRQSWLLASQLYNVNE
ncbi:MAG: DUF2612 domain-containing protein [Spirochaetaceae bacterium]|nr:DUF2612 domain-containing protein [Spirochaetaceae bacterium]